MKLKPTNTHITLLLLFLSLLPSCKSQQEKPEGIITIDVAAALNNLREFRLSELVESIEYVKLETRPECLVSAASRAIGKKYIVLLNSQPRQVMLFDRSGKFIRLIGKIGKGPGEYTYPQSIDLSPDEERILVADGWQRQFMEFSIDGSLLSNQKAPLVLAAGPFYIDQRHIIYMQSHFTDSIHYPRILSMDFDTGETSTLHYSNFKRNPDGYAGYCFADIFNIITNGIVFKEALSDTIFQVSTNLEVKPVFCLNIGSNKAIYPCMTEQEFELYSNAFPNCLTSKFLFVTGTLKGRSHLVFDIASKTTFRLPELKECRGENDYPFGIINDLGGTGPVWFWYDADIRYNAIFDQLQMVDLKELIQTDCFNKAELKTEKYRDQLRKLVEESSENDNPVIRILHLKK